MRALILFFLLCATTVLSEDLDSLEHYCYVQSPTDFTIFNLTTLYNDAYDSSIRLNDEEHLRVHFCGPLRSPCNGKQNYAACLHDRDKEVGIGREPPNVTVESDKIMLRYRGDRCNYYRYYTLSVEMKCHFSMKEKIDENLDVVYDRKKCDFQMTLQTAAACAKGIQTTCDLKAESGYFNLKPLMDLTSNYIIKLNQNLSVILNVCHSLIYGKHFKECNHETMVCLVDETIAAEPIFTRLGNINQAVRISASNGSVYLNLTSDTPCDGQQNIRTTIKFVCKKNATNELPMYTSGFGTCHYKFTWVTAAACSEDILIKQSEVNHEPCKITDPLYNRLFDLSMLEGNDTFATSTDNTAQYQLSVCSPLQKSNCTKEGTGVCKYIKGKNIAVSKGQANTKLMWRRDQILLNYTDGVACGNNQRSYTVIVFGCTNNFSSPFPMVFETSNPCATYILWHTPLICDHRCAIPNSEFKIHTLRSSFSNYLVPGETPDAFYFMNVCEPLIGDNFTSCTYGTGICKVVVDDNGTWIRDINLGHAESGLRMAPDGRIYLSHVNGSVCEEDRSKRISSEITFICDKDYAALIHNILVMGESIFTSSSMNRYIDRRNGERSFAGYNNCKYDFIWKTHYVCPKNTTSFTDICLLENNIHKFDLLALMKNRSFQINTDESTGYFNGSACNDLNKCHGTFICDNWLEKRKRRTHQRVRLITSLALKFENKPQCKTESFLNSWIAVWCYIHEKSAETFLIKPEQCSIGFNWAVSTSDCENESNGENAVSITEIVIIVAVALFALIVMNLILYCCRSRVRGMRCLDGPINAVTRCMNYILVRQHPEEVNNDIALEERL